MVDVATDCRRGAEPARPDLFTRAANSSTAHSRASALGYVQKVTSLCTVSPFSVSPDPRSTGLIGANVRVRVALDHRDNALLEAIRPLALRCIRPLGRRRLPGDGPVVEASDRCTVGAR